MQTILFLSSHSELGGAQHSLLDIVRSLDDRKYRPLVVLPEDRALSDRLKRSGIETVIIPFQTPIPYLTILDPRLWLINLAAIWTLYRLAQERRVALIHCNDGASLVFASLAAKLGRIPLLFHVRWFEAGIRRRLVHLFAALLANRLVANSEAVKKYVQETMPWVTADITVVYNAINTEQFRIGLQEDFLRNELRIPKGQPLVGMVGRFVGWKNHETLIHAARRLKENGHLISVCFVGTTQFSQYTPEAEPLKASLEQLVRSEQLEGMVHWLGYREEMERVMPCFDVLVCPSANEPFGRVVIEAMACGVPVVAARSGGIPEIITHGEDGLLFPLDDTAALADCLTQLLTDNARRQRLAERARSTVERRFSIRTLAQSIDRVYKELLMGK